MKVSALTTHILVLDCRQSPAGHDLINRYQRQKNECFVPRVAAFQQAKILLRIRRTCRSIRRSLIATHHTIACFMSFTRVNLRAGVGS